MLDAVAEVLGIVTDATQELDSGMNSGRTPSPGPTGAGAGSSSAAGGGGGGEPSTRRTPGDQRTPGEREMQRDNARDTAHDLASEVATRRLRHGRLLGNGSTVVDGAVTGAEGIVTVSNAVSNRHAQIEAQTGHNARNEANRRLAEQQRRAASEGR